MLDGAVGVRREPLAQGPPGIDDEIAGQLVAGALQRGEEDVEAPAREVVVEQVAGDPGALGDVVEREARVALLGRDGERGPRELRAPLRRREPAGASACLRLSAHRREDLGIFTICQLDES